MRNIIEECLLRNFEMISPSLFKRMVSYEMPDNFSLIVTLDDNQKILFDDMMDSIRYLYSNPNNMSDEELLLEFRYRLRHVMSRRGFNQLRLAEETGLSELTISNYMRGKNIPSFLNVMKIAKVLECSLDELWYT